MSSKLYKTVKFLLSSERIYTDNNTIGSNIEIHKQTRAHNPKNKSNRHLG